MPGHSTHGWDHNFPFCLEQFGIDKHVFDENIEKMAKDAFISGSPSNTRKNVTMQDMERLYEKLWLK